MAKERKQKIKNNNNLKLPTFKLLNIEKKRPRHLLMSIYQIVKISILHYCIWYYKHTAFSWGCYGRLPHEGRNITLWKKNIVSGDILFPECDIFSRLWSSTITPSTKGSMFFIILNASSKENFEFLLELVN